MDRLQSVANIVTGGKGGMLCLSSMRSLCHGWGVDEGVNLRLFFPSKAAFPDLWRVFAAG